ILPVLIIIILSSVSSAQEDKCEAWKSDIEYLKTELPARHKDLFFKIDKNTFERKLDELIKDLPNKTKIEIVLSLQKIIAEMGDDHTGIDYKPIVQNAGIFPLTLYWFSDGLYVLATLNKYESALGSRITAINDIPIAEVTTRLSSLLAKTNDALVKHRMPNILPSIALLRYFEVVNSDSARFDFIDKSGAEKSLLINKLNIETLGPNTRFVGFTPESYPLCWQNQRSLFWSRFLKEDRILYVQYNRCWSKELEEKHGSKVNAERLPSFTNFTSTILEDLKKPETEKFALDLRFNPGGSSPQGTEFAKEVGKIARINKKGCLFVIIGKRTYSSAVINAIDFKKHTEAILIGEPTSGKPNHFGEVNKFRLPNSGLSVSYSTKYFKYLDEDADSLVPDITVETSFKYFASGKDPALDAVRQYNNK
ncbi:MAG: S41 family peptidase, partial [Candidatus Hodarchaeota archaeon]